MFQNRNNNDQRRFQPDFTRFPAAIFESDDWGACETAPDPASALRCLELFGRSPDSVTSTLESSASLEALFDVLRKHHGADGQPAVFTAFTSMGNPDFTAIAANGFEAYADIGFDRGLPPAWHREGVLDKMRAGQKDGIWEPEYHSMLHHVSPRLWMQLLNSNSQDGHLARELFKLQIYAQNRHIPEYEGYTLPEQNAIIRTGFNRFCNAFGRMPHAAVTSDAYPETEILWVANGIRTICLKNCRINSGEVVVYPTKPWNNQNVYTCLGAYQPELDAIYLTRNAFFELDGFSRDGGGNSATEVLRVFQRNQKQYNEPAIISTHRSNYCSFNSGINRIRLQELGRLLTLLKDAGVSFLSSHELAELYRLGWSRRGNILRKWCDDAELPEFDAHLFRLPGLKPVSGASPPAGNYLMGERT